jgi:hypothetical protein
VRNEIGTRGARERCRLAGVRFAVSANDHLTHDLVKALDDDADSYAATWRAVGNAAERAGLRRPSYELVRRLARLERRRRAAGEAVRRARIDVAAAFLLSTRAVDTPIALERLREATGHESLVTQWHEAGSAPEDAAPREN